MLKQHSTILLLLTCMLVSDLFGQDKLNENIVSDTLLKKLKIKKVIENWYVDSFQVSPANTNIEIYNEQGLKTQGVYINHFYHKFVENYSYNLRRGIVVMKRNYFDWNPYREKRKGDTILKKSVLKYDIITKRNKKTKLGKLEEFKPEQTYDRNGRLIIRIDSTKFGYSTTTFDYRTDNKIVERKQYIIRLSRDTLLNSVDSLYYNINGQKIKEINYYDFKLQQGIWKHGREVITTFSYMNDGLILSKTKETKFLMLTQKDTIPNVTIYKYEYEFY